MNSWITPSLISLVLYGCWGFLGAKASQLTNTKTVFFISCIGTMAAGFTVFFMVSTRLNITLQAMSFSLLTGLATGFGTLMFVYAMQRGPAIPIVMITALYPMVTLILATLFLNETITLKQSIGILFTMIAIYCLAIP